MTYAELLADVEDTLDRGDVATRLPRWLRMVEARLNRLLDDPEMEVSAPVTGDGAPLPDDFGSMVSLGSSDGTRLAQIGNVEYASIRPSSGTPRYYTIREGKIYYVPGSAVATLVYRRQVPRLTEASGTNWLLDRAPDLYFYGVLLQAEAWQANEGAAAGWKALWDEGIAELQADGARRKWGSGSISPRIRRA